MITNNTYVSYDTCGSRDDINSWLNTGHDIFSNRSDYKTVIAHQCDYKDMYSYTYGRKKNKKVYSNIYAHQMEVMIPVAMTDSLKHDFIKKFMCAVNPLYKLNSFLYCYKFITKGKGSYISVLCFTRKYFKRQRLMAVTYEKDYIYSSKTKRLCKKDDPDAVLVHKKGDIKKDEHGSPVKETFFVSKTEQEIFKYTSFIRFHKRLLKNAEYAAMLLDRDFWNKKIKYFSRITIKKSGFKNKEKIDIKNQLLIRLNSRINSMQTALQEGRYWNNSLHIDKAFHKMIHRINGLLYLTRWTDPVSGSSIYLGTKQSVTCLKDNISLIEEHIEQLLTQWWADEVYSDDDFTAVQYTEHEADSVKSLVETDKYWKDFNNNKWSKNRYSYEEALEYSRTLVNCRNCINCLDCRNCKNCTDCIDCSCCTGCCNCFGCVFCIRATDQHHYMEKPSNNGYWDDSLINTYLNLKEREAA